MRLVLSGLLAASLLLGPARAARAEPPFTSVDVKVGDVSFSRLYNVRAAASSDPNIATVEFVNATNEVLISGKAPGRTDVVVLVSGRLIGIRVLVRSEGKTAPGPVVDPVALLATAKKACPGLSTTGDGADAQLTIPTPGAACRIAAMPLLASGRWTVPQTHVAFDADTITLQLQQMETAVKATGVIGVQLRYQGAQLMVAGHLSSAEAEKVIVALYHASVGGMPLNDDELELNGEDDGGF